MNCRTARQYVQRELDGELSIAECEALHKHLDVCEACRAMHRQFVATQAAIRQLAAESDHGCDDLPPIAFGRPRGIARSIPWRAGLAAAAAVVALCVGSWFAASALRPNTAKSPQLAVNQPRSSTPAPEPGTTTPEPRTPAPGTRSAVRVRFEPASNVIAVPVETRNPNVTIIWMYPTFKTGTAAERGSPEPSQTMPTRS